MTQIKIVRQAKHHHTHTTLAFMLLHTYRNKFPNTPSPASVPNLRTTAQAAKCRCSHQSKLPTSKVSSLSQAARPAPCISHDRNSNFHRKVNEYCGESNILLNTATAGVSHVDPEESARQSELCYNHLGPSTDNSLLCTWRQLLYLFRSHTKRSTGYCRPCGFHKMVHRSNTIFQL